MNPVCRSGTSTLIVAIPNDIPFKLHQPPPVKKKQTEALRGKCTRRNIFHLTHTLHAQTHSRTHSDTLTHSKTKTLTQACTYRGTKKHKYKRLADLHEAAEDTTYQICHTVPTWACQNRCSVYPPATSCIQMSSTSTTYQCGCGFTLLRSCGLYKKLSLAVGGTGRRGDGGTR